MNDMIADISDLKNSTRESLQQINNFSNVAGYKIHSKKISSPMNTRYLTKKIKLNHGKKKASSTNGTSITGCEHVEECK